MLSRNDHSDCRATASQSWIWTVGRLRGRQTRQIKVGTSARRTDAGDHLCCAVFRFMHPSLFSHASTSSDQKVIVRVSVVSAAKRGTGTTRAGWAQEERQTERGEGWLGKRKWSVIFFFFLFGIVLSRSLSSFP